MAAADKKEDDDSDGAIHKMDTLPPPEGEDDAYSAATKVGPMAPAMVEAMMAMAQVSENSSLPPPASFTRGVKLPKPARLPTLEAPRAELGIDKLDDEVDDGDLFEPTSLLNVTEPRAPSQPAAQRGEAPWTNAPTIHPPAPPLPQAAPNASGPPITKASATPSTLATEVAIFAVTFAVLSVVALIAYVYWLR